MCNSTDEILEMDCDNDEFCNIQECCFSAESC